MLYLEHCLIFYDNSNFQVFFKIYFLPFNIFLNIMENGTFASVEQIFLFSSYFKKILLFQRRPKAFVWEKG